MAQKGASQQEGPSTIRRAGNDPATDRAVQRPLTEEESRVLECLQKAGEGLTARQLEARSACSSEALQGALEILMGRKLVARLNTIVPSYTARVESNPVDAR
jgi:hypothetical protein